MREVPVGIDCRAIVKVTSKNRTAATLQTPIDMYMGKRNNKKINNPKLKRNNQFMNTEAASLLSKFSDSINLQSFVFKPQRNSILHLEDVELTEPEETVSSTQEHIEVELEDDNITENNSDFSSLYRNDSEPAVKKSRLCSAAVFEKDVFKNQNDHQLPPLYEEVGNTLVRRSEFNRGQKYRSYDNCTVVSSSKMPYERLPFSNYMTSNSSTRSQNIEPRNPSHINSCLKSEVSSDCVKYSLQTNNKMIEINALKNETDHRFQPNPPHQQHSFTCDSDITCKRNLDEIYKHECTSSESSELIPEIVENGLSRRTSFLTRDHKTGQTVLAETSQRAYSPQPSPVNLINVRDRILADTRENQVTNGNCCLSAKIQADTSTKRSLPLNESNKPHENCSSAISVQPKLLLKLSGDTWNNSAQLSSTHSDTNMTNYDVMADERQNLLGNEIKTSHSLVPSVDCAVSTDDAENYGEYNSYNQEIDSFLQPSVDRVISNGTAVNHVKYNTTNQVINLIGQSHLNQNMDSQITNMQSGNVTKFNQRQSLVLENNDVSKVSEPLEALEKDGGCVQDGLKTTFNLSQKLRSCKYFPLFNKKEELSDSSAVQPIASDKNSMPEQQERNTKKEFNMADKVSQIYSEQNFQAPSSVSSLKDMPQEEVQTCATAETLDESQEKINDMHEIVTTIHSESATTSKHDIRSDLDDYLTLDQLEFDEEEDMTAAKNNEESCGLNRAKLKLEGGLECIVKEKADVKRQNHYLGASSVGSYLPGSSSTNRAEEEDLCGDQMLSQKLNPKCCWSQQSAASQSLQATPFADNSFMGRNPVSQQENVCAYIRDAEKCDTRIKTHFVSRYNNPNEKYLSPNNTAFYHSEQNNNLIEIEVLFDKTGHGYNTNYSAKSTTNSQLEYDDLCANYDLKRLGDGQNDCGKFNHIQCIAKSELRRSYLNLSPEPDDIYEAFDKCKLQKIKTNVDTIKQSFAKRNHYTPCPGLDSYDCKNGNNSSERITDRIGDVTNRSQSHDSSGQPYDCGTHFWNECRFADCKQTPQNNHQNNDTENENVKRMPSTLRTKCDENSHFINHGIHFIEKSNDQVENVNSKNKSIHSLPSVIHCSGGSPFNRNRFEDGARLSKNNYQQNGSEAENLTKLKQGKTHCTRQEDSFYKQHRTHSIDKCNNHVGNIINIDQSLGSGVQLFDCVGERPWNVRTGHNLSQMSMNTQQQSKRQNECLENKKLSTPSSRVDLDSYTKYGKCFNMKTNYNKENEETVSQSHDSNIELFDNRGNSRNEGRFQVLSQLPKSTQQLNKKDNLSWGNLSTCGPSLEADSYYANHRTHFEQKHNDNIEYRKNCNQSLDSGIQPFDCDGIVWNERSLDCYEPSQITCNIPQSRKGNGESLGHKKLPTTAPILKEDSCCAKYNTQFYEKHNYCNESIHNKKALYYSDEQSFDCTGTPWNDRRFQDHSQKRRTEQQLKTQPPFVGQSQPYKFCNLSNDYHSEESKMVRSNSAEKCTTVQFLEAKTKLRSLSYSGLRNILSLNSDSWNESYCRPSNGGSSSTDFSNPDAMSLPERWLSDQYAKRLTEPRNPDEGGATLAGHILPRKTTTRGNDRPSAFPGYESPLCRSPTYSHCSLYSPPIPGSVVVPPCKAPSALEMIGVTKPDVSISPTTFTQSYSSQRDLFDSYN